MSIAENKAIARRFAQVWGNGNVDKLLDELAAPDIVVKYPTFPRPLQGKEEFKQRLQALRSAYKDSKMDIEQEIAEGDKVVLSWTFSGTHTGTLMNIPPSGKKIRWTGISLYHIAGGKVKEEQGEEDMLGALRQAGYVPQPKPQ